MRNLTLSIVFLFILTDLFSQNNNSKADSIHFEKKMNHLIGLVNDFDLENKQSKNKIKSLEEELLFYRVKEDYFSVALGEQANRFAMIIGGLLGILALLSFGGFRYELNRIIKKTDKRLNTQSLEFKEHKKYVVKIDKSLNATAANNFISIAISFQKEKNWVKSLQFY